MRAAIAAHRPQQVLVCEPGEYRVRQDIEHVCREAGVALEIRRDSHFLCGREEFATWAKGRRELRMEYFYREMRRRHEVLMDNDEPAGDRWNFDAENRAGFPKTAAGNGDPVKPKVYFKTFGCRTNLFADMYEKLTAEEKTALDKSAAAVQGLKDLLKTMG